MKKTVWGPLYWNFLHNLVIRIKNEEYMKEKNKIWEIINDVNKRTRKKEINFDEHLKKYNKMNFINVLNEFFHMNLNQQPSPAMIMQKFARKRFIMTLVDYFRKNLNKYDTTIIKED